MKTRLSYYPTLEVKNDTKDYHIDGSWTWTNMPDPKYDYADDNDDGNDDEMEAISRRQDSMTTSRYNVNIYWQVLVDGAHKMKRH
ncbi:hypothetical protein CBW46_020910 [Paenibacillus xerothermodurans]|uniref:Uncharacterized protein n=1 Tax=Paenibacillus xerothermodurans TaxID=1977292 RepID=A0A2W1NMB4_PAEXE|nr:hypothetical protein CBW46_020910 [Paenibacillus xerothermodurans]